MESASRHLRDFAPSRLFRGSVVKRIVWKLTRIALVAYIGLALVLSIFQTHFIFPGASTQGSKDAIVTPSDGVEILSLKTKTGETVAAMFGKALDADGSPLPDASTRPTIVYFYGNGMSMSDCAIEFAKLRRRGFNMIVPDYLGYGMSTGKPSEQGVYATADAAFDYLLSRSDIDAQKIVPFGWSLGAGAAIHLAQTRPPTHPIPCLVTVSAFTSIPDMARRLFPYLPTSFMIQHRFENERKLKAIKLPIFIAHGRRDGIIPFDMSEALAQSAAGPVTHYPVDAADHNDIFETAGPAMLDAIAAFINEHTTR